MPSRSSRAAEPSVPGRRSGRALGLATCLFALLAPLVATAGAVGEVRGEPRPALRRPTRLAEGGFPARRLEVAPALAPAPWQGPEPAAFLLERLGRPGLSWAPLPAPRPRALGDRLVLSVDDGIELPIRRTWEGRLDVSGGVAGASDAIAVRFPSQSLAKSPPFRVTSVIVGLDDLHGATTWPSIEAWLEDRGAPLSPRRGSASAISSLDAVGSGLPRAPSGSSRPTDLQRLPVALTLDVPDAWLSDGAFDDPFGRPDGLLDDGASDWLECQDGECLNRPATPLLRLQGGTTIRATSGFQTLAVKFPDAAVEALRRPSDIDQRVRVTIRHTDANFSRAGVALRASASDTYYRVEYVDATTSVEVAAVIGGAVSVLNTFAAGPSTGTRVLEVQASGGSAQVDLAVSLDGVPLGTVSDTTFRLVGGMVGLSASDPASRGEEWDDFIVERRPDIFAVIGFPPGENAALPIDLSVDSVRSDSILVSTDGVNFAPRGTTSECAHPGNPLVQLEVEDSVAGDRLFDREAHVVEVAVSCATCPPAVNTCFESRSMIEASPQSLMAGEELVVTAGWWNEHLDDETLIFTTSVFNSPCDALTLPLLTNAVVAGLDGGQLANPADVQPRVELIRFTPALQGEYCVVVVEQHDSNFDCCPDGAETLPLGGCPGPCVVTAPSDSNPATAYSFRDVRVVPACTPRTEDVGRDGPDDATGDTIPDEVNLDGGSLRVSKSPPNVDAVLLSWDVVDVLVFPARYNILRMDAGALPDGDCFRVVGPVFDRPSGTLSRVLDMPLQDGCLWFAIYETDGCGGDASVRDSSADDIALRCP